MGHSNVQLIAHIAAAGRLFDNHSDLFIPYLMRLETELSLKPAGGRAAQALIQNTITAGNGYCM